MKSPASEPHPEKRESAKFRRTPRQVPLAVLAMVLAWCLGCGQLRPPPGGFEPQSYAPIGYQDLLNPTQGGLHDGQMVRVKAYFWQLLNYDPAMVRNYLKRVRYPLAWRRLRWFAVYGSADMQDYYDLAAIDPSRLELFQPKRLEPVLLYGQISSLGKAFYLHVHHIEKIPEE